MDTSDLEKDSILNRLWFILGGRRLRSLIQVSLVLVLCVSIVTALKSPQTLPFGKIQVLGDLQWIDKEQLNSTILGNINGGFFSLDVGKLNEAVNAMPWVSQASVRRQWPDTLQVIVREHQPVASWNNEWLLNTKGGLFAPAASGGETLAGLRGPQGTHSLLLQHYEGMQAVLSQQGLKIATLEMNERRALKLQLQSGTRFLLGRVRDARESSQQLKRFIKAYQAGLRPKMQRVQLVDLRYTNGLSVRWQDAPLAVGLVQKHNKKKG